MNTEKMLQIVATDCKPEDEEKFNKWYNEIHIPLLLKYPGMVKATRYKLHGESPGQAKYLAIYEFKDSQAIDDFQQSNELADAITETNETWKEQMFDMQWVAMYEPVKIWEK